jgi:hypothetical protein
MKGPVFSWPELERVARLVESLPIGGALVRAERGPVDGVDHRDGARDVGGNPLHLRTATAGFPEVDDVSVEVFHRR